MVRARLVLLRTSRVQPLCIRSRTAAPFHALSGQLQAGIVGHRSAPGFGQAGWRAPSPALSILGISHPHGREAGGEARAKPLSQTPASERALAALLAGGSGFRFVPGTHAPSLARPRANGCAVRRLRASRDSRSGPGGRGTARPRPVGEPMQIETAAEVQLEEDRPDPAQRGLQTGSLFPASPDASRRVRVMVESRRLGGRESDVLDVKSRWPKRTASRSLGQRPTARH